jgi:glycosyltransferase involved in cell wall biosynthesis
MKNCLNLLLITVRADYGGGPKHVDLLIDGLNNINNLYIACPDDDPYYSKWKNSEKVKGVIKIPHRRLKFRSLHQIRKFCIDHNINVVHSHGKGAGFYSRLLKLVLPQIRVVHTYHGLHIQEYSSIKAKAYIIIEKFFYLFTNRFVNVSYGEQMKCIENNILKSEKSVVIYNGINNLKKVLNQKKVLGYEGVFVVATITRFDEAKNMELAYHIAKSMRQLHNVRFLWIGDGPGKNMLVNRSLEESVDNIDFVGFQEDVSYFLSASDIYLSTSKWEGLPFALIEALSLGIPLVASNVVGNNEVVQNNFNGFLYKLDDVAAANEHILKLYRDPILLKNMSDAATRDFQARFLKEKMISQLELLYDETI